MIIKLYAILAILRNISIFGFRKYIFVLHNCQLLEDSKTTVSRN